MLRIEIQSWNGVATLHCYGRVVFGVEAETLRTMVQARPESSMRVSMAEVEKIDATGLGLLIELQNWAADTGRNLVLIDLSLPVWRLGDSHQALRVPRDFLLRRTAAVRMPR